MIKVKEQCKNCFHFQVCANVLKNQLFIREKMLNEENPKCVYYISAANVVESPCKVGDTVYIINRNKVKKCEVIFVGISLDKKCSYFNFVENYADGTFYKSHSMVFDVIGKTVFLTRKAAEQALKERSLKK